MLVKGTFFPHSYLVNCQSCSSDRQLRFFSSSLYLGYRWTWGTLFKQSTSPILLFFFLAAIMSLHQQDADLVSSEKQEFDVNSVPTQEAGASDDSLSDRHHGTYHDVRDMGRLGKKQEFMVCLFEEYEAN
jgi:hypothetical protein